MDFLITFLKHFKTFCFIFPTFLHLQMKPIHCMKVDKVERIRYLLVSFSFLHFLVVGSVK